MNDRLEIASRFMTALIASGSQSYLKTEAGNQCLAYADALIAAEGSGKSEIPTSHEDNDPNRREWSLRRYFDSMRHDKKYHLGLGDIRISHGDQDMICNLVEESYGKPANVPSVEEMRIALNIEMGYDFSGKTLSDIHQWLTERAKG